MKDVFKNMRGAGLGGLLLMAVVFAVSVVLAGGLYFAKIVGRFSVLFLKWRNSQSTFGILVPNSSSQCSI